MKNSFRALAFIACFSLCRFAAAQTPTHSAETPPSKIFDLEVSLPFSFIGTQDMQNLEGPAYYNFTTPEWNHSLQVNFDYYLNSDFLLGVYYQRLDRYVRSSYYPAIYSGVLSNVGLNGFGFRGKKEFSLSKQVGLDPFLALGVYFLDGYIEDAYNYFYLSGTTVGGEIGLGLLFYLDNERDVSLELDGGYRVIVFNPVTASDISQSYFFHLLNYDSTSASFDFSGWFINFLELKATLSEAPHSGQGKEPAQPAKENFFVKGGVGVVMIGDYYLWDNLNPVMVEGGLGFPDGFSFFAEEECFATNTWSTTGNIQYSPTFFHLVKPYVFLGAGMTLWFVNPSPSFGIAGQIGFGSEFEMDPKTSLFIEGKFFSGASWYYNEISILSAKPVQIGLKLKL